MHKFLNQVTLDDIVKFGCKIPINKKVENLSSYPPYVSKKVKSKAAL